MRIITGTARGCRLETPSGDEITRPTSERVKESVFSMIQFEIEGRRVLDLFAGSGQIGLEALSRGAASCVFVDSDSTAIGCVRENATKAKLMERARIIASDSKAYLRRAAGRETFDICFLDPPYQSNLLSETIGLLVRGNFLAPQAIIVCESESETAPTVPDGLVLQKHVKYGRVHISLFRKVDDMA